MSALAMDVDGAAQHLRAEWLPATAPPRVGHDTHLERTGHVETYIIPQIGGVPLRELNAARESRLYTLLLKAGVPLHVVSRRLGHASEVFTDSVYAHVLPGQQREAAETFSQLVFGDAASS